MSTYKAHIFKQRSVGGREEVKLKLFMPDGTPIELGGDGAAKAFNGWSDEISLANNGEDVVVDMGSQTIELDQGNIRENAPAGIYLIKFRAMWGAGSGLTSGAAQVALFHITDDDVETLLAILVMSPEENIGDMPLSDIHFIGEKIDMGSAPADGRLELRASQSTNQFPMTLTIQVVVAKL